MISQTAEYALRAIVFLADNPGEPHTADEIARGTKVPVGYLAKIMQGLARNKLVNSQRGLRGGFTLILPPGELTVYDVVQAVEPILRITTCPLDLEGHGANLCPLHRRLDDSMAQIEAAFRTTTILQLIEQPGATRPLCSMPGRS